jgi:chondroitin 4-sulfotransferase 11
MSIHIKKPKSTFIHIPKTGGESISAWMSDNLGHKFRGGEKHDKFSEMKSKYHDLGFTWCVVRNPWDRVLSGYHYYKRKDARILRDNEIKNFGEFLKMKSIGKTLNIPQTTFVPENIDLAIRFENLKEEFKQIQEFYNIKTQLPHKNSTKHQHYSFYYTEQWMIDLVAKKFPLDIKRYNYDFEYK